RLFFPCSSHVIMPVFDSPRANRYNVKLKTVVAYRASQVFQSRVAEARSISKNGMAIILHDELPIGATVQLTLPVHGKPMHLEGIIRNRNQFTYGIAFVHAAKEQRNMLANYCCSIALASALLI